MKVVRTDSEHIKQEIDFETDNRFPFEADSETTVRYSSNEETPSQEKYMSHDPNISAVTQTMPSAANLNCTIQEKNESSCGSQGINNITFVNTITQALGGALKDISTSEDILKLGVGLGMSLGAQGLLTLDNESSVPKDDLSSLPKVDAESDKNYDEKFGSLAQDVNSDQQISSRKEKSNESWTDVESISLSSTHKQGNDEARISDSIEGDDNMQKETKNTTILFDSCEEQIHADLLDDQSFIYPGPLESIIPTKIEQESPGIQLSDTSLPKYKPVGRLKPRAAGEDWQAINFDPWSSGKQALTVQFIPTLTGKMHTHDNGINLKASAVSLKTTLDDNQSGSHTKIVTKENKVYRDYLDMCRCVRHHKYAELENMMNSPDLLVPIDYCDKDGNTLLMISCQNGNKRIAKLCLRRGSNINLQNTNGQTCLHYAFGYGFGTCLRIMCKMNHIQRYHLIHFLSCLTMIIVDFRRSWQLFDFKRR